MDCELGESLAIQLDSLLVQLIDEDGVLRTGIAKNCVQADDPQGAEVALLLLAIHVGMLTSLDHAFLGLHERGMTEALITLGELLNLLVPTGTDDTALYTHGSGGKLQIRKKCFDISNVRLVENQRAVQTLLALVLLGKQVVAAVALHCQFAGAGLANPLLCAAV